MVLHTVPSRWMVAGEALLAEPYRRVVGVETSAGLVACRFAVQGEPEELAVDVPPAMAERVSHFFDEHLADVDPEAAAGAPGRMRYNCHVFAFAVQGERGLSVRQLDAGVYALRERVTPLAGRLTAGAHGVVDNPHIDDTSHGFIGLGEAVPFTLQVMNTNSNMGLLTYQETLALYSRHQGGEYVLARGEIQLARLYGCTVTARRGTKWGHGRCPGRRRPGPSAGRARRRTWPSLLRPGLAHGWQ